MPIGSEMHLRLYLITNKVLVVNRTVPVAIVSDGGVGDGGTGSDVSAQQAEDGAAQPAKDGPFVEAVDDENRRLDHHNEIADSQVEDQDVAGRLQLFRPFNNNSEIL